MKKDFINQSFDNAKEFLNGKQQDNKNIAICIKNEISTLESDKIRTEKLAIDGTFTKEVYLRNLNDIEAKIISKKIQLSDYKKQIINLDELIEYCKDIFLNLSNFWFKLDTPRKRSFQEMLFPEGIYLGNNDISNHRYE